LNIRFINLIKENKCGICGENILTVPKRFEKGGDMYVGKIVETYIQGQVILATIQVY
jgi:hypothetical protein